MKRLIVTGLLSLIAVLFTMGTLAAQEAPTAPPEEAKSCVDLKAKVCTICGDTTPGCEAIKKETDTEENCKTALDMITDLEKTLTELNDKPTEKLAWEEFCKALAEEE